MKKKLDYFNIIDGYNIDKVFTSKDLKNVQVKLTKSEYKNLIKSVNKEIMHETRVGIKNFTLLGAGYALSGIGLYEGFMNFDPFLTVFSTVTLTAAGAGTGLVFLDTSKKSRKSRIEELKKLRQQIIEQYNKELDDIETNYIECQKQEKEVIEKNESLILEKQLQLEKEFIKYKVK